MKLFAFASLVLLVVGGMPQAAKALPFKNNCGSLQAYLNTKSWSQPTKLSGFENVRGTFSERGFADCDGGYITETSPMGTRVCLGAIWYSKGSYRWNANATNCRWK